MKNLKFWINPLSIDLFVFTLAILGLVYHVQFALNVFIFVLSLLICARFAVGFFCDETAFKYRPKYFVVYHIITDIVLMCLLAGYGYFFAAWLLFLSLVLFELAKKRKPKTEVDNSV